MGEEQVKKDVARGHGHRSKRHLWQIRKKLGERRPRGDIQIDVNMSAGTATWKDGPPLISCKRKKNESHEGGEKKGIGLNTGELKNSFLGPD